MLTSGRAFGPWSKRCAGFAGTLVVLTLGVFGRQLFAQTLDYTGSTLTQNFNTLSQTGTGNAWSNGSTLNGWFGYSQPASAPVALTTYNADNGSLTGGALYSYGNTGSSRITPLWAAPLTRPGPVKEV